MWRELAKDERVNRIERTAQGVEILLNHGYCNVAERAHFFIADDEKTALETLRNNTERCSCIECKARATEQRMRDSENLQVSIGIPRWMK